jgi:hypothetical protein
MSSITRTDSTIFRDVEALDKWLKVAKSEAKTGEELKEVFATYWKIKEPLDREWCSSVPQEGDDSDDAESTQRTQQTLKRTQSMSSQIFAATGPVVSPHCPQRYRVS